MSNPIKYPLTKTIYVIGYDENDIFEKLAPILARQTPPRVIYKNGHPKTQLPSRKDGLIELDSINTYNETLGF
jgi:hypothetical protein